MSYKEREKSILDYLMEHKTATICELCSVFFVSEPTMRRDLRKLSESGKIIRSYGSATYRAELCTNLPHHLREREHSKEKLLIAARALELIRDGDTVMIDASSTAHELIQMLPEKKSVILITNNAKAPLTLSQSEVKTFVCGGELEPNTYAYIGSYAEEFFRSFNADICFFSIRTLTRDGLLTDNAVYENAIRKIMLSRSRKKVLLMDSEKIGEACVSTLSSLDGIDYIICEKDISILYPLYKNKFILA